MLATCTVVWLSEQHSPLVCQVNPCRVQQKVAELREGLGGAYILTRLTCRAHPVAEILWVNLVIIKSPCPKSP